MLSAWDSVLVPLSVFYPRKFFLLRDGNVSELLRSLISSFVRDSLLLVLPRFDDKNYMTFVSEEIFFQWYDSSWSTCLGTWVLLSLVMDQGYMCIFFENQIRVSVSSDAEIRSSVDHQVRQRFFRAQYRFWITGISVMDCMDSGCSDRPSSGLHMLLWTSQLAYVSLIRRTESLKWGGMWDPINSYI